MGRIPERLRWAVEVLAPDPADAVLEIGCGTGVAAGLILERLSGGTLTAIDRSAAMVRAAERRNRAHVRSGRARFLSIALEDADFRAARFDRVLAVNVNRFWLGPADESSRWGSILRPGARVCLVYQPPAAGSVQRVAAACSDYFRRSGFSGVSVRTPDRPSAPLVCIRATWG